MVMITMMDEETRHKKIDLMMLNMNCRMLYYTILGILGALGVFLVGSLNYDPLYKTILLIVICISILVIYYLYIRERIEIKKLFEE
jgi:hypothetical protein